MYQPTETAAEAALSIREFAGRSGYSEATVRRAMRHLSITGQFQGRGKATLLSSDEQQRIALQIDDLELQAEPDRIETPPGPPMAAAEDGLLPETPLPSTHELESSQRPQPYSEQPNSGQPYSELPEPQFAMGTRPYSPVAATIATGNHRRVVEPPTLPERYDLAQFRSRETIATMADPGAIAAQAMGAIDALVHSMDSDIQQQQVHLQATQQAAQALRLKAKQLQDKKIEYMIQSSTLGQAQQQTTLELQEALEEIQSLGKSPSDGPKSPSSSH